MREKWYYGLLGIILGGIARLPFRVLYAISDLIFIILYYIVHYRRRVAYENIRASFPEKSDKECHDICRRFFVISPIILLRP